MRPVVYLTDFQVRIFFSTDAGCRTGSGHGSGCWWRPGQGGIAWKYSQIL